MTISKEAYQAMGSVVGAENITDDPAIGQGYRKGGWFMFTCDYPDVTEPPSCVVLPENTEQVQAIVKICNRYKIPFTPISGGWLGAGSFPFRPNSVEIDLQKMKGLQIDDRNMYAVVEPGVTYGELHTEALKRGLWYVTMGCGGQTHVVSNTHFLGVGPLGHRMGCCGERRELGYEWVTPTGSIVPMGSPSLVEDYFWGEGPGPDLKGILRDQFSHAGGLGIITKMGVKLFPFIPPSEGKLEPYGISPTAFLELPTNRVKWYNLRFPTYEKMVDAMYKIGEAEIGTMVYTVPPIFLYHPHTGRTKSRTELLQEFEKDREKIKKGFWLLRVLLVGYVSEKELLYEEEVLKDIAAETDTLSCKGGSPRDHSWIISMDAASVFNVAGVYNAAAFCFDSIDSTARALKDGAKIRDEGYGVEAQGSGLYKTNDYGWMHTYEFGHTTYGELVTYFDAEDTRTKYNPAIMDYVGYCLKNKVYAPRLGPTHPILGPAYQNYHKFLRKLKSTFDPNGVANLSRGLTYPLDAEAKELILKEEEKEVEKSKI